MGQIAYIFVLVFGAIVTCPSLLIGFYFGSKHRQKIMTQKKQANFEAKYRREFKEESDKEFICMICKLEICSGDFVYICPNCNSHYHEEHFNEWLKVERKCPVCDFDFSLK